LIRRIGFGFSCKVNNLFMQFTLRLKPDSNQWNNFAKLTLPGCKGLRQVARNPHHTLFCFFRLI
jgi:hypothetical protein